MSTVVLGKVTINQDTVYSDDFVAEAALFDISAGASLLLLGDDQLNDTAIGLAGQIRADGMLETNGLALTDDATLVNISSLTQVGSLTLGIASGDAVRVRNLAGATWDISANEGVSQNGAGSSFVNFGLFEQTGIITVDADFIDRSAGTVDAIGTIAFAGSVTRIFGEVGGSGTVTADDIFLDGAVVAAKTFDASTVVVRGIATITSTNVEFSGASDTGALYLRPGSSLQFQGQDETITLGNVYGAGEIDLQALASLHATAGTPLNLIGDLKLVNSGQLTLVPSGPFELGDDVVALNSKTIHGGTAEVDNLAGAIWTDGGTLNTFVGDGTDNTFFDNAGLFQRAVGNTTFELDVINDGVIKPVTSIITFDNPVTGAGTIDVDDATVSFNAPVSAGQTVAMGPGAALAIEDVPGFAAVITDFNQHTFFSDGIGFNTSIWQYQEFAPNANATGGALIFSDGAAQTSINLSGAFDPMQFHAAISGNQTVITYG